AWLVKAGEVLGGVPDGQGGVVESFSDEMGGRHAMVHSVFGMKVNGAWGMAPKEKLRRAFGPIPGASHVHRGNLLSFDPVPALPRALARAGRAPGAVRAAWRGADRLPALRRALPSRRRAGAVHPPHVQGPADARVLAAPQGRCAARDRPRPARLSPRGRDP